MDKIEALLTELGIKYELRGDEAWASCVYHSPDRNASWSVNIRKGVHSCFSCGAGGSLCSLVSHLRGISYTESVLYVNDAVGWARADQWREDFENKSYSPPYFKVTAADMALFTDPPAEALKDKSITAESCDIFNVKWNPAHESWICPYYDPHTYDLWGWQEKNKRIFRNYPAGTKKSKTLFGYNSFFPGADVVLLESPLDCCRLYDAGYPNGLSSSGAAVSEYQLSLITRVTEHLILALDNDSSGRKAQKEIASTYIGVKRLSFFNYGESKAKDIGEMTDEEIKWGMKNLISSFDYRRGNGK